MNRAFLFVGKTFAASVMLFFAIIVFQVVVYGGPARDVAAFISGAGGISYTSYVAIRSRTS
ncbi:hypothetical protein [Pseudovibrio sp. Tun.PSC04-5.I4]|uniref:hypothetical protein n=1 Tax=Pseudovibrio sp. Tun.PSC04-5.I4 TaxID=1798213 RepID=UPI00088FE2BE|nr:hypothetical protein [Pseudovibrio sp. Tun.PSC04-5.I4]SDQ93486.1 hypothetical protein SAMN04515695_1956 [Pseudovibrio sp. Tun.PSC04-5.I4]